MTTLTTATISNNRTDESSAPTVSKNASIKKRSRDDWQRLIAEWENSGLSQKTFCEQRHINLHNFVYHRYRRRQTQHPQGKFASIRVTSKQPRFTAHDQFVLQLQNNTKLWIPNNYDMTALKKLLTLLEVLSC
jgi:hypothetical protein